MNISRARVCGVWWCTWLIMRPQCACTQVTSHLKPHCSYRKRIAVSAHCCTLSQTVHGTQNTLWMCTVIERNMEEWRQCTYNVTEWCVRVTSVAVENHCDIYSECVCVCLCVCHVNYPTRKARCGLSSSALFSTLSHKPLDFVKNLLNVNRVVWFSLQICTIIFSF
jgi:hypothetical protein